MHENALGGPNDRRYIDQDNALRKFVVWSWEIPFRTHNFKKLKKHNRVQKALVWKIRESIIVSSIYQWSLTFDKNNICSRENKEVQNRNWATRQPKGRAKLQYLRMNTRFDVRFQTIEQIRQRFFFGCRFTEKMRMLVSSQNFEYQKKKTTY